MRRIKQTVASVGGASINELIVRETKYYKTEFYVISKRFKEIDLEDELNLNDFSNYYNANSNI